MYFKPLLTTMALCALLPAAAPAADPQVSRVVPAGGQRGTQLDLKLEGQRLDDAQGLLLYEPGIEVKRFEAAGGKPLAHLMLAPDCRVGYHALRVRTASGISNLVTFSVGTLPEIDEVEPNNDFQHAQKIPLNVTVNGVVENEDVDYFAVEAKKGQRLSVEIEGLRLGETFFDPCVAIYDAKRFLLAGADDTPLVWQDAALSTIAPEDGAYFIEVRESSFGGSNRCRYRLHVGTFPRPLAVLPAGGRPGESLEVRWLGDAVGPWTEKITLPARTPHAPREVERTPHAPREAERHAERDEYMGLLAHDDRGTAPSSNPFRISDLKNVLEVEPNDTPEQATPFEAPAALNGAIAKDGDVDMFKFSAKQGQVYDVRVYARSLRSPLDSVLEIRRSSGAVIAANDDTTTPDSYLRLNVPADDRYTIAIRDHLGRGGPEYVYRIEVTPVRGRLVLDLPERQQYVDVTASVPKGNRIALMLNAQREDFGGEVALEAKELPQGVGVEMSSMPADQNRVPVLFTASDDAPLASALIDFVGRAKQGDQFIESHLVQRTTLVRGQNNGDVWGCTAERMAMAVVQSVPFRVEIVEAKVPLVQSGSMEIKIVARRQRDFKGPINLTMLYDPPGVSNPSSVTIPEGKDETVLPLTADRGAPPGVWKIAVIGEATVGDGAVRVSSQLARLEVSEPFFKFAFPSVACQQGQETELAVKVEKQKDFEGKATVELLGLPNEVTSRPQEFTKDSAEVVFPIQTTDKSPPGLHKTLVCRAVVTVSGEPVTHILGNGELRIQPPLAKKPAVQTAAVPPPKPEGKPSRHLSRLEQLRLERK
jgi:hypothetical protein